MSPTVVLKSPAVASRTRVRPQSRSRPSSPWPQTATRFMIDTSTRTLGLQATLRLMSSPNEAQQEVTRLLHAIGKQEDSVGSLLPIVYDQLRAIAQKRMDGERANHTLDATALVHEVYLKLVNDEAMSWESRGHFFGAAATAMRRILIDHARKHRSQKRGGGKAASLPADVAEMAAHSDPDQIIAVDEAVAALEQEDERAAAVVRLRFYAGLSVEETAAALELSERTVMREWTFARARLFQLLEDGSSS